MPREFWGCTWRELHARRKAYENAQKPMSLCVAQLLSALHNGPMMRKDQKHWSASMFMPDYQPEIPVFDWKRDLEATQAAMPQKPDPKKREIEAQIQLRMKRSAAAQATGATAEQVSLIMRGLL